MGHEIKGYLGYYLLLTVFGVDLTTLVKLEGKIVPNILSDIISEIESRQNGKGFFFLYILSLLT